MSSGNSRRPRSDDDRAASGLLRGMDLLWESAPAEPPTRRATGLDREQIVRAAIHIADKEGLDAVTMRRVAQQLRTGAMSLYRHVPDKDALVTMMIETVLGDAMSEQPPQPTGWRESLRALAESVWELSRRHRWYPEASIAYPPLTPNGVAGLEYALSIFDPYDIDIMTRMQFVGSVHHLALHAALDRIIEEDAQQRLGVTNQDAFQHAAPIMKKLAESGQYPHVTEFLMAVSQLEVDEDLWQLAGVDLILDGIEARLAGLREPDSSGPRQGT
ncbi:MAG TPA: TetR/AcrR family transcriptional regulator C-terminal domain-containing protein [Streptosporangiaceae bacterium]|nr:TetR/AcrR family transcriptional regulator C-terminal domain-containing protein [Streptosporangiaceae bacterium]